MASAIFTLALLITPVLTTISQSTTQQLSSYRQFPHVRGTEKLRKRQVVASALSAANSRDLLRLGRAFGLAGRANPTANTANALDHQKRGSSSIAVAKEHTRPLPLTIEHIRMILAFVLSKQGEDLGWNGQHKLNNQLTIIKTRTDDYSTGPRHGKKYRDHIWTVLGVHIADQQQALQTAAAVLNTKHEIFQQTPVIVDQIVVRFNNGEYRKSTEGGASASTLNMHVIQQSFHDQETIAYFRNRAYMTRNDGSPKSLHHNIHIEYDNTGQPLLSKADESVPARIDHQAVVSKSRLGSVHLPGAPGHYVLVKGKKVVICKRNGACGYEFAPAKISSQRSRVPIRL